MFPSDFSLPVIPLVVIYLLFAVKHLLADYILQTSNMALGKGQHKGWLVPLFLHASVHASLTTIIAAAFVPSLWWLGVFDLFLHGAIDRGKALVSHRGRWTPADSKYWWLHGVDQFLHQVSHFGYVILIVLR